MQLSESGRSDAVIDLGEVPPVDSEADTDPDTPAEPPRPDPAPPGKPLWVLVVTALAGIAVGVAGTLIMINGVLRPEPEPVPTSMVELEVMLREGLMAEFEILESQVIVLSGSSSIPVTSSVEPGEYSVYLKCGALSRYAAQSKEINLTLETDLSHYYNYLLPCPSTAVLTETVLDYPELGALALHGWAVDSSGAFVVAMALVRTDG